MSRTTRAVCAVIILAAAAGGAARADDAAAQRARIAAERVEANAVYDARAAECAQRFVVTACMNDARRQRRDALDRLQRQQVLQGEIERKQRAAQRIDAIRNKVAAEASGQRQPPDLPAARLQLREAPAARAHAPAAHASPAARAAAASQSHQQQRWQRAAGLRQRQAEALAHRQAVERRNAQRAASGKKPAAALPVPGAASATR